jgi:predicted amidophosphoribosyltransferase
VSAAAQAATPDASAPGETCPLCGAPLKQEQSWCLRCGAAARTRLAAQPKWKVLAVVFVTVVVISLGVLAAALVKLAG